MKIHHLGHIQNKENFKKITFLDINPYELTKNYLLDLGSDNIIKINEEVLKLGEFILYGSSLFVDVPNDYDLLYYGDLEEDEVQNVINKFHERVNVLKYTEEKHKTGKITHLLYAIDNGVKLNDCTNLERLYKDFKGLSLKQYYNKYFLAINYLRDYMYDKEIKTLIIAYYYKYKTDLGKFIYDHLHIIYKIVGDGDKKAEMLFNRMLFLKFKRNFVLPVNDTVRRQYYGSRKVNELIDIFFPETDFIQDEEKVMFDIKSFEKAIS